MFLKSLKIMLLTFIVCVNVGAQAAPDDYVFDPKDPHHTLYVPDGKGPFPVVLLLHASTGVVPINHDWAMKLKNRGYVVYVIDSFKPRGWTDRASIGWEKATDAQLSDVTPAYQYLTSLPFVDSTHIGLIGFSMGGFDVLRVMEKSQAQTYPHFDAAASFYGVCHRLSPVSEIQGQTKIFIGEKDDRGTTDDCRMLVERSIHNHENVSMLTYQHALHGFDNNEFPASKEMIDEKGEHYHIGYNEEARQLAMKDLFDFFDSHLK